MYVLVGRNLSEVYMDGGLYPMYVATRRAWGYARLARLRRTLPMQHADTPQVVGTCHGMSPKVMLMRGYRVSKHAMASPNAV